MKKKGGVKKGGLKFARESFVVEVPVTTYTDADDDEDVPLSALQVDSVAGCCRVLQCVALCCCSAVQCGAVWCSVVQCGAACFCVCLRRRSVVQCVFVCACVDVLGCG